MNEAAGIGIRSIKPELNTDRIDGIVNKVSAAEQFDDVAWALDEPIVNFTQSVVDDAIKANAEFQHQAGLSPKIIRKTSGKCCEWCARLAGTYNYEDVRNTGNDVFRRHSYCRCTVEYSPGRAASCSTIQKSRAIMAGHIVKFRRGKEGDTDMTSKGTKLVSERKAEFEELLDLEFEQIEVNGERCYRVSRDRIITVTPIHKLNALVIEYADGIEEALTGNFEDGDIFSVEEYEDEAMMYEAMLLEIKN